MTSALIAILALTLGIHGAPQNSTTDPELIARAKVFLARINKENGERKSKVENAEWDYHSNLNETNRVNIANVLHEYIIWQRQMIAEINAFPWREIDDYDIKRQFKKLSTPVESALPQEKYAEYREILNQMKRTQGAEKNCAKEDFIKYVELSNEIARLNNYTDMAAFWMSDYEADDFAEQIERLWQQLKPLYLQLHAYGRHALKMKYRKNIALESGLIPSNLLYNMSKEIPYPGKRLPDLTNTLIEKIFNATMMFKVAENFFTSINLSAMPDTFWEKSILEKPDNVELICRASAWDFYDGKDFRITACTKINMKNFLMAHHEMGHIQYFLQYKNQPTVYKGGANAAFHEAIGETIGLSASTPKYLKEIGLLEDTETDREAMLNYLYTRANTVLSNLIYAYRIEKWRWGVFQSHILPNTYNCQWWNIAEELQGIAPLEERTENDFDPGQVMHAVAGKDYIRYFLAFVLQFQFHKALCIEAGQYDPANPTGKLLSDCSIYRSVKAGNLLKSMLELGASRPWQDAMEKITGQRNMDASAFLEYFKPLQDWLEAENSKNNVTVGWTSGRNCTAQD